MNRVTIDKNLNLDLSTYDSELSFVISNNESNLYLYNLKEDNNLTFEVESDSVLH